MHATPEGADEPRMDSLERIGSPLIKQPECESVSHLLSWLFEFGPSSHGAMGPVPVAFSEIQAWASLTGTRPTSEESLILRSLSREYVAASQSARAKNATPPYAPGGDRVGAGIMAAFKMSKVDYG